MRPKPYIGITGFTHWTQVEQVHTGVAGNRTLMVGALVSSKTLRGETNKWPHRYPKIAELKEVFVGYPKTFNLVHYSTDTPGMLLGEMLRVREFAGQYFSGFQLNIAWPDPRQIEHYHRETAHGGGRDTIVLQIGTRAYDQASQSTAQIATKLRDYQGLADYVLIDGSGGKGIAFDPEHINKCFSKITETLPDIGLALGGGLSANTIHTLSKIDKSYEFSIDAEGQLRGADDTLILDSCRKYLRAANNFFPAQR